MKISLNWLKDYISVDCSPEQIAKRLTSAGLEVDSVEPVSQSFEKVVVAQVQAVRPHPQADKLCVADVFDGVETHQVVCGASNCREKLKTAFAPVGASITDEKGTFRIKRAKLRGVESFGMLCAGSELGLSSEEEGIMEFADHVSIGADVASLYGDTVLEISLTPNLGHCTSYWGVARELFVSTGKKMQLPVVSFEEKGDRIEKSVSVEVRDSERCPRYACRLIRNVTVGSSPDWLQQRLLASGIRPVNAVVDATNYVLMEQGHPLHAFDFACVAEGKVVVRCAEEGETLVTLDDKERIFCSQDLLICDEKGPLAIAGVMGGKESEISLETKDVLLEAAYFQPSSVRRTSKRLGLQTDASKHFERHVDPNGVVRALDRAAALIQQIAGGEIAKGILDQAKEPFAPRVISCRPARVNQILGTSLGANEMEDIFQRLECVVSSEEGETLQVQVPTYRADLHTEIDLVEEVARIYGYDNITSSSVFYQSSRSESSSVYLFEKEMRTRLVGLGLQEFISCDLIGPTLSAIAKESLMKEEMTVRVLNPTSVEQSILRTSLLPGLLNVVKHNRDRECPDVVGFEIGRIHYKDGEQYKEQSMVGLIAAGRKHLDHWRTKPSSWDFYSLKGLLEGLLSQLGIEATFKNNQLPAFHTGRQASLYANELEMGTFGEVHPTIQRRLDVTERILFAELNLQDLFQARRRTQEAQPISPYPGSVRDWTVTLPRDFPVQKLLAEVRTAASPLLESVTVIDLYEGEKVAEGCKNITMRLFYRNRKKTIAQEAVDREHEKIMAQVNVNST